MNDLHTMHLETRAWYGPPVLITVASDHKHRVVVSGIPIPHIGLVNMIARWRMPIERRLLLTAEHELGHIQTLPFMLPHLMILLIGIHKKRSIQRRWLVGLIAHHAAWELAAECYVIARHKTTRPYSPQGRTLYTLLWSNMISLTIIGTYLALTD